MIDRGTYLDHYHREREDICFLASFPAVHGLRRRPPIASNMEIGEGLCRIHIRSDRSEAETHYLCAAISIHKDI